MIRGVMPPITCMNDKPSAMEPLATYGGHNMGSTGTMMTILSSGAVPVNSTEPVGQCSGWVLGVYVGILVIFAVYLWWMDK